MTEYVSVHPDRLRDLARKLQAAASTVREKTPTIVNGIDGWDGSFSGAKLTALADWLDDQWRPMFDRADLAATAARQTRVSATGSPPLTMFQVPLEITEQDLANEGMRDAIGLRQRMNSEDPAGRDAAQREAAEAMEAHADDPAYLQAFFNGGGAEIITTMNRQIVEQGVPPSDQNQNRLRLFSTGVAAASRFAEGGTEAVTAAAAAARWSSVGGGPVGVVTADLRNGLRRRRPRRATSPARAARRHPRAVGRHSGSRPRPRSLSHARDPRSRGESRGWAETVPPAR